MSWAPGSRSCLSPAPPGPWDSTRDLNREYRLRPNLGPFQPSPPSRFETLSLYASFSHTSPSALPRLGHAIPLLAVTSPVFCLKTVNS